MCAERRVPRAAPPQHARGVTLIELLVALVVASLVSLAAVSVAAWFNASQRQAVSASATSVELASTLSAIKAEIGSTALGFVVGGVSRCPRWNLAEGGATLADEAPFLPFSVTRDPNSRFDRLDVVLVSEPRAAAPVRLAAATSASATSVSLRGWLPVRVGEQILIAPEDVGPACTVRRVTAVQPALPGGTPYTLELEAAAFGAPLGYLPSDRVSVLGRVDRRSYAVNEFAQLVLTSSQLPAPAVLLEHVMAWRVQYGVAAAGSGSIEWMEPDGAWGALDPGSAARVRALRLGLLARSPQRDKACDATTALPRLFGAAVDVAAADPSWRCWRYRQAEVVVPLRNVAWGSP
jgi:type IV pilus assembly protein PilW